MGNCWQSIVTANLHLANDETAPARAGDWITRECNLAALPDDLTHRITTCVVEAINNTIAHQVTADNGIIRLKLHRRPQCLVICIRDSGPSAEGKIDIDLPAAEAIGGRGWFIISHWMDIARYKRCGNNNVVTLAKQLSKN
jgi:anti-sigma regulatory factor (Ser/Thr protein kinase)